MGMVGGYWVPACAGMTGSVSSVLIFRTLRGEIDAIAYMATRPTPAPGAEAKITGVSPVTF
jgi:hypothetical protein